MLQHIERRSYEASARFVSVRRFLFQLSIACTKKDHNGNNQTFRFHLSRIYRLRQLFAFHYLSLRLRLIKDTLNVVGINIALLDRPEGRRGLK